MGALALQPSGSVQICAGGCSRRGRQPRRGGVAGLKASKSDLSCTVDTSSTIGYLLIVQAMA